MRALKNQSPNWGGLVASLAPGFNPGPSTTKLVEDRVKALEKGKPPALTGASPNNKTLMQRTEDNILLKVRASMLNEVLPQAILASVEPRIRDLTTAHN